MAPDERKYINGLIRYYKPKNVLEIGVSQGWGTVNILNAISDMDAQLVSIDIDKACGEAVSRVFSSPTTQWTFFGGSDPSELMESIDTNFDFVVIDSAHLHPVEELNFLPILPWLNSGAIVVLHDTTMYKAFPNRFFAPRLLLSSVCAEKLEITVPAWTGFSNVVAFQIS